MRGVLRAILPKLARLRGPVGSEQEMSFNRLVFAIVFLIYLSAMQDRLDWTAHANLAVWSVLSVVIFLHIRIAGTSRQGPRRALAMLSDMGFLTWFLHIGGAFAAPFFPVYLWVALGNGFRFGRRWLVASMGVFVVGFSWVVVTTPYWQGHGYLAAGLVLGPCVLGLYASALIHTLSNARRLAEQANEAKSLFLASVSHDLRTPLHAIIGTGSLLRGTRLDDDQREMTRTIDEAAQTLLSRIGGILDYCRLEAGDPQPRPERFVLPALLAEVRRLLAIQAGEKGLSLTIQVASGTPWAIVCDRAHLRDVLLNLVGNAVKFTAAGTVVITVRAAIEDEDPALLRFEVIDTGIGVAPAVSKRIFEQFVQADGSIMNRYGGTGLGLAICRRLVDLMRGEIGVDSSPGQGSRFWFTILAGRAAGEEDMPDLDRLDVTVLSAGRVPDAGLLDRIRACGPLTGAERVAPEVLAGLCGVAIADLPEHLLVCIARARAPSREAAHAAWQDAPDSVLIALASGPALPPLQRQRVLTVLPALPDPDALRSALLHARALLPGVELAAGEDTKALPGVLSSARKSAEPTRILLAEDNAVNRRVVQRLLERAGFSVETAGDGEEALDRLEAGGIDIALMDVNMPVMDGVEATKLYRFIALDAPRVPIIGLTADATPETARRCLDAGMDKVVTKPVGEAQLLQAILACRDAGAGTPAAQPTPAEPAERHVPVLDPETLRRLAGLGGAEFLAEVAADFDADAVRGLDALGAALEADDATGFRIAAHGLRSSAASVGAVRLAGFASAAEAVRTPGFASDAPRHLALLSAEVREVRRLLAQCESDNSRHEPCPGSDCDAQPGTRPP